MGLAPGTLAMITITMTQKQGLEPMPAAAQIIDRMGSRSAQIANGLIGRFRNVDGFEFAGTEQPASFTASRRSVFIRSPGRFGVIEGATTMQGTPSWRNRRAMTNPQGPAS